MKDIIQYIMKAKKDEIDEIAEVSLNRKRQLYPDWEIHYIALPKTGKEEYRKSLEHVIRMLDLELQDLRREKQDDFAWETVQK